jgi:hypothetical protein
MRVVAIGFLLVAVVVWPAPVAAQQATCRFVLGFAALRDLVGSQKVGACLEDEHFNLENGNSEQRTTGGLLVWRKIDNFTAFTDGSTSWVNGPNGLQSRPNGERFSWERDPAAPASAVTTASRPPSDVPFLPTATATPRTVAPLPTSTPTLASAPTSTPIRTVDRALAMRCYTTVQSEMLPLAPLMGRGNGALLTDAMNESTMNCQQAALSDGEAGVDCYLFALHQTVELMKQPATRGAGASLGGVQQELYRNCINAGR